MSFQKRRFGGQRGSQRKYGSRGNSRGGGSRNRIKYMRVDPRVLVKKAEPVEAHEYTPIHQFSEFGLDQVLLKNVERKGYSAPTPIQDKVIPEIIKGKDVIGIAATGTGKTASFLLPIIHKISVSQEEKTIIITPTRELAVQIVEEGASYARGIRCHFTLIIGGVDMRRQINELRRHPQVVVGTPGRLKDLMERNELKLGEYKSIVLDEVDRMLDMGFVNDISTIVAKLPKERSSLFFSATMSDKARQVADKFLHDPIKIQVESQRASDNVDQDIVRLNGRGKVDVLHDLLIKPGFDKVLVFGRTKRGMEKLASTLNDRGFRATAIHGNKSQNQRQRALNAFKQSEVKVLLATDVASRGIDIDDVSHVINYELPETYDDYIHRIGRTGRADKTGVALTFID